MATYIMNEFCNSLFGIQRSRSSPTWILHPILKRLLQPPDVERLRRHPHERHDLQELLFPGLAKLQKDVHRAGNQFRACVTIIPAAGSLNECM